MERTKQKEEDLQTIAFRNNYPTGIFRHSKQAGFASGPYFIAAATLPLRAIAEVVLLFRVSLPPHLAAGQNLLEPPSGRIWGKCGIHL